MLLYITCCCTLLVAVHYLLLYVAVRAVCCCMLLLVRHTHIFTHIHTYSPTYTHIHPHTHVPTARTHPTLTHTHRYEHQLASQHDVLQRVKGERALLHKTLTGLQQEAAAHADVVAGLNREKQQLAQVWSV